MDYAKILKKLYRLPSLSPSLIIEEFKRREGVSVSVEEVDVGKPGFKILSGSRSFLLLEHSVEHYNKKWGRATSTQSRLLPFGIPIPLYLGQGEMSNGINKAINSEDPSAAMEEWLHNIFEIDLVAAYFLNFFSKSESLKEYRLIILEAIESFYMGLDHAAIMSLIPVFEGGLRNLQNLLLEEDCGNVAGVVFEKRLRAILKGWGARRVSGYDWHPGVYGVESVEVDFYTHICPQSDVINCFSLFFKDVLYKPAGLGNIGFNRHVIVHMLGGDFNRSANFYRVFLALTHITFIESLTSENVPFFWTGYDDESRRMGEYLRKISKIMDGRRNFIRTFGVPDYPREL
ncbi:hypothetical protein [Pseudomonas sichuanensis]|uniref:hypothetical protein n=1 Tax=Pseudomonas sichuanensis TaxID=2213015 RepID=UPI00215F91FC|nr:hypothetical protein [Pseudomonas sichuanensis]UVL89467.1 hypothetical protein LOY51_00745 [Pseudomonas sichuanensis]